VASAACTPGQSSPARPWLTRIEFCGPKASCTGFPTQTATAVYRKTSSSRCQETANSYLRFAYRDPPDPKGKVDVQC
jgi:hypothetical protein